MYDYYEYDFDTCWEQENDWNDLAESERAFDPADPGDSI